jgi:hypothetical protein
MIDIVIEEGVELKGIFIPLSKEDFKIEWSVNTSRYKSREESQKFKPDCHITHIESGAMGKCHKHKGRQANKKEAFDLILRTPKFVQWLRKKLDESTKELYEELIR